MKGRSRFARRQRMTIVLGILSLVLVIVILQLWLFAATMNAYLGGDESVLWPAALASLDELVATAPPVPYLYRLDR